MSSDNVLTYPDYMFQLVDAVMEGRVISVPHASIKEAKNTRFVFYAFRRAASKHAEYADLARKAAQITAQLDGTTLHFVHTNLSPMGAAFAKALGKVPALPDPVAEPVAEPSPGIPAFEPENLFTGADNDTVVLLNRYQNKA